MPSKVIKRIEDVMKEKETERFQSDVKTVVEKICSALNSVCSVMQAQAEGLKELVGQSEVSDEIKLELQLAEERISKVSISMDVDRIRCHLEGHKLVLKELKRPIAFGPYRNTYRCERCQWSFGLDASEKLKRLY
ncbi:MAG: hypothetical protein V3T23_10975 [Nitrososphaerales archaeon]